MSESSRGGAAKLRMGCLTLNLVGWLVGDPSIGVGLAHHLFSSDNVSLTLLSVLRQIELEGAMTWSP